MKQPTVALPTTKQARRRLVTTVLNLTEGTRLAPQTFERMLLDQFIEGELTIDEVLFHLERQAADN